MSLWHRFARFNVVGALGIFVQLTVLWVLFEAGRVAYLPATVAAVVSAVLHNFVWHVLWTWRDRSQDRIGVAGSFARFVVANGAVSLVGNSAIMAVLVGSAGMHPVPANVIAIAICGVVNFWLGGSFVFRKLGNEAMRQ